MSPQKYWNVFYRYVVLSAILLALAGVGVFFFPKVTQFRSYQETKTQLKKEIRTEDERIKELRLNQEKFSTNKRFVERIAHNIGFAHESEIIFQFGDQSMSNNEVRMK